jgi:hypothetical protein
VTPSPTTRTWILTGSLENFRVNAERGFDLIGLKERRRRQAQEFEPGDEVVFYVTGVQAFGAIARVRSHMFEDRAPIWPQLAFQGQLRTVGEADAQILREHIDAAVVAA